MRRHATAACAILASLTHAANAGTLQHFDLPGHTAICGAAIDEDGAVVGNSITMSAPPVNFLYRGGEFTIQAPVFPAGFTVMSGIGRGRTLVGTNTVYGRNFTVSFTGFQVHETTLRTLRIPGAVQVIARGIGNDDVVVGSYQAVTDGPTLGFIKRRDSIVTLNDGSPDVMPQAVDPSGARVVGTSQTDSAVVGWLYQAGTFSPIAVPGAAATFPNGVNRAGVISGTYLVGSIMHGFLLKGGTYETYDVPGASLTQLNGINGHGAVTGCYADAAGTHGLIYTP